MMNSQEILDEVRAEYKAKWEAYGRCTRCGLEGEGENNPWRHTYRFEADETICKRCGADYYDYSEQHEHLTTSLKESADKNEKSYDHHAEYRNTEVHAIQEREAS